MSLSYHHLHLTDVSIHAVAVHRLLAYYESFLPSFASYGCVHPRYSGAPSPCLASSTGSALTLL
jgi:hypothetical protein